jgi:phospholipase D1/2
VRTESRPLNPASKALVLEPGRNCWRVERADRAAFIIDAEQYYRMARKAMMAARHQILLVGWDVDTRICLDPDCGEDEAPEHLGPLVAWLLKNRPELHIHVLAWDGAAYNFLGRGSTLFRLAAWMRHKRMHFRFDGAHPREASHHQKILVIDDCLAFCGGIDITGSRWDTRDHCDDHPGRRRPTTRRRYGPWHDTIMAVDGDAAKGLGDLARLRWKIACDEKLPEACDPARHPWPRELEPTFRNSRIAIARTRGKVGEWNEVREIEALFADMIGSAERFVYIENQYFASRVIARAIARRLEEPDPPEFVLINPKTGLGWLDESVMGPARAELLKAVWSVDRRRRLRVYTPVTEAGADIYVHSKLMIVDDLLLRVGSANLNNRSMGLDSECDLMMDGREDEEAAKTIGRIRADLMAEHLGSTPDEVEARFRATGSLIGAVEALRGSGRTLVPFEPPETNRLQETVANSEILDPESADDKVFEPQAKRRLLTGLPRLRRRKAG